MLQKLLEDRKILYLRKHWLPIPNYKFLHSQGISIGSGTVESAIKQIGWRVKLSGAQWKAANVPQMMAERAALRPTNDSWRIDKTYIQVKGQWKYLYRAVDSQGNTPRAYHQLDKLEEQ